MERKSSLILNIWRKGGRKAALLYFTTSDKKLRICSPSLNPNLKLGENRGNLLINIIYKVYDKNFLLRITKKIVAKLKV